MGGTGMTIHSYSKIRKMAEETISHFYPDGTPSGVDFKVRIHLDSKGKVVVQNVTEKPEFWHLPVIDVESFTKRGVNVCVVPTEK